MEIKEEPPEVLHILVDFETSASVYIRWEAMQPLHWRKIMHYERRPHKTSKQAIRNLCEVPTSREMVGWKI